jgi:hypothetical protein
MSTVTELGDLWERQALSDLQYKRNRSAKAAEGCKPGGEYQAQILRMVAMYDRMIAAASTKEPQP